MEVSEIQTLSINQVDLFFLGVANEEYKKLRDNVQKEEIGPTNTIKLTQQKPYIITEEQAKTTPKFSSINIDSNNKQKVTIFFAGKPELGFIKNKLHLHSANYTSYSPIDAVNPYTLLSIKETSLSSSSMEDNKIKGISITASVLANLMNIYNKISIEAGSLIWEALKIVVSDNLDKETANTLHWKHAQSYDIDAWAESAITNPYTEYDNIYYNLNEYFNYQAKIKYLQLPSENQTKFLETIIDTKLTSIAQEISDSIDNTDGDKKYQKIKDAFNTLEKCNTYVESNIPFSQYFVQHAQNITKAKLEAQAAPGFFEKFIKEGTEDAKFGITATKATMSVLKAANINVGNIVKAGTDVLNLMIASARFGKTADNKIEIEVIKEISDLFICMNLICNSKTILNLTEKSSQELMEFYSTFIYQTIRKNDYNEDILDYLLDKISDPYYIKSLGLHAKGSAILSTKKGEKFTISSFIASQDKIACYDTLLEELDKPAFHTEDTLETLNITDGSEFIYPEDNSTECSSEVYIGLDYSQNYYYDIATNS